MSENMLLKLLQWSKSVFRRNLFGDAVQSRKNRSLIEVAITALAPGQHSTESERPGRKTKARSQSNGAFIVE